MPDDRPARPARPVTTLTVTATSWVTPGLRRLELRSDDLAAFGSSDFTDRYVKLRLTDADGQPAVRTYTALEPDVAAGTLAIEFVVHGDTGVAGPWAAAAEPGDTLELNGPGGAYRPDPDVGHHLLVGDEAALPAIRAALEVLAAEAPGAHVAAYLEVEGPEHEVELPTTSATTITWVHRGSPERAAMDAASEVEPPLLTAVRGFAWPEDGGRVQCFVHGEAQVVMHALRPYLFTERGLPREDVSVSGYWRRGRDEVGFREWKAELRAAEE